MDTFLIFFFIFGIFGWCIWMLLRYTRDTIGKNSPLKVKRTYQISKWEYFTRFECLFVYYFFVMGLFCLKLSFTMRIAPTEKNPWLLYLLIFVTSAVMLGIGVYCLILEINHWEFTKDVVLETNPELHELEISFKDLDLILKEGDLQRVVVTASQAKYRFCYHTYYLTNGDHFILSDRMPGNWVIQEFFKKIPVEYHYKSFPYIV